MDCGANVSISIKSQSGVIQGEALYCVLIFVVPNGNNPIKFSESGYTLCVLNVFLYEERVSFV